MAVHPNLQHQRQIARDRIIHLGTGVYTQINLYMYPELKTTPPPPPPTPDNQLISELQPIPLPLAQSFCWGWGGGRALNKVFYCMAELSGPNFSNTDC